MWRSTINPAAVFDSVQFGFSQAVVTEGGRTIRISGQVGWDAERRLAGEDLESQLAAAMGNLDAVLAAAGATLAHVASLRIYVVEAAAADLAPVGRVLRRSFPTDPPAATWLVVRGLADPGLLVEVEAAAVVP
ncbi:MAG TPA: RidA family protein [Acidimicrobiia bacterium]|jgi:enamine deaminase RidA (YjgF/YER057c/UK114 family)|nr:RidA family protein [Acidimicrobiia bacterium]